VPELVAPDLAEYERMALELAHSPELLAQRRATLVEFRGNAPLFDSARYCRHFEAGLERMWALSQREGQATHISIPAGHPGD
jgi:predicted O-linked N-acetylglucosamine transferase (SPINDLY family)